MIPQIEPGYYTNSLRLLSPSSIPLRKVKVTATVTAQTHARTHAYTCRAPQLWTFLRSNPNGGSVPMCKQSRRTAAKCKKRMTQPRSLVRLFVMISLILLICSVSYQAVQAGLLQSRLLKKKAKKKSTRATRISNEDLRICVQKCKVSYNFPSHRRRVLASAVCKGMIRVCFLAVPCLLSQSRAQPCVPPQWFLWVRPPAPTLLHPQSDYNEQSQLFGELTHSLVHRFVML